MTIIAILVTIAASAVFATVIATGTLLLFGEFSFMRVLVALASALVLGFAVWGFIAVVIWAWSVGAA